MPLVGLAKYGVFDEPKLLIEMNKFGIGGIKGQNNEFDALCITVTN